MSPSSLTTSPVIMRSAFLLPALLVLSASMLPAQGRGGRGAAQTPSVPLPPNPRADALKKEAIADVDRMATFTQQMVDQIFSYGELGFQEVETSRFITKILRDNGFTVQEGAAGMPTAWIARWGSGSPVIAIG